MQIDGKKALVFGGTSGIGLATTQLLAGKGATVVALSRDPSKAGDPPANVSFKSCDVRDEQALKNLFASEGPFDILVSAATGGERAAGPFLEMDMAGFQGSFAKMWGYANVVRHGTQHLSENGSIVLVSGAPARRAREPTSIATPRSAAGWRVSSARSTSPVRSGSASSPGARRTAGWWRPPPTPPT